MKKPNNCTMPSKSSPTLFTDALPERAREIADILGIEGMLKLSSAANNRHVYVPKLLTHESALVKLVGWDIAKKLYDYFPGELLFVPKGWFYSLSPDGIQAMRKAHASGVSCSVLAKITGLSESGVRAALRRKSLTNVKIQPKSFTNVKTTPPSVGSTGGGGVRLEKRHKSPVVSEKC
jgi:hypothetical protein